jgi:hypothetical protein
VDLDWIDCEADDGAGASDWQDGHGGTVPLLRAMQADARSAIDAMRVTTRD